MPFVRRAEIDPKILESSNAQAKARLRAALFNPALKADQRRAVKEEIALLGMGGRIYDANRPPRVGSV